MINENKIQSELYRDLSHCIRLFTQKNKCVMRISKDNQLDMNDELQTISEQCKVYIRKYQNCHELIVKHWIVVQRFLSRVKEISINLLLKNNKDECLSHYLSSILGSVSDNKKQFSFSAILKNILLSTPISISELKPQKFRTLQQQKKSQSANQTQIFLKSLERDYLLYEGIGLDNGDYRKRFFMSREQLTRKNNVLADDMVFRNRFIRDTLQNYRNSYETYRCRSAKQLRDKKNKIKTHKPNLSNNLKSSIVQNASIKSSVMEKRKKINISMNQTKNKRVVTTNRQNTELSSPLKFKSTSVVQCKSPKKHISRGKLDSEKRQIDELIGKAQKDNIFHLTKINFFENKMEIGSRSPQNKNTIRKKILFKKTEENVYRKCDFLTKTIKKSNRPNFETLHLIGVKKK